MRFSGGLTTASSQFSSAPKQGQNFARVKDLLDDIESDSESESGELSNDENVESATQSFQHDTVNNANCPVQSFDEY